MHSGTPLYSHICRFKFDVGAVTRRAFTPGVKDLNGHLVQMCNLLRFIRRNDINDMEAEDQLLIAYVAMLDNDGKNRAQLQHAGIEDFVDRFVRRRLWVDCEANDGWPQENVTNSCALWLMWMFTTKGKLDAETEAQREELIRLIFPYIACPLRYPCALVPPNHFTLPLGKSNPVQTDLFTGRTAHGSYPLYHIIKTKPHFLYYYRGSPSFLPPLITPVAKLLYWCRRERVPFFKHPGIPATRTPGRAGLTQEDLDDFNSHKAAKLLPNVVWDWDTGAPVCRVDGVPATVWKEDESARWDQDWWRARLCDNIMLKQPRWRLGSVYVRGMISGMWFGVQFMTAHDAHARMLAQARLSDDFGEGRVTFGARPLLMKLSEHGFVRTPSKTSPYSDSVIPPASPAMMPITVNTPKGPQRVVVPIDVSLGNAWFPGPAGSVKWVEGGEALDDGVFEDRFHASTSCSAGPQGREPMSTTRLIVSSCVPPNANGDIAEPDTQPGSVDPITLTRLASSGTAKVFTYETFDQNKESVHGRMEEAKASGRLCRVLGTDGVTRTERHPGCVECRERESFIREKRERDVAQLARMRGRGVSRGGAKGRNQHSSRSRVRVEEIFKSVGMGKGDQQDEDDELLVDLNLEDDDEDDEMEDVDMTEDEEEADGDEEDEDEETEDEDEDEDDLPSSPDADCEEGEVADERVRRSHDRYRLERCHEVEDVVITGGLDEQQTLAWSKNVYYGRVRPWDGLVAILRVSYNQEFKPIASMVYYGYIYGGNTFVGNWRDAGTSDPLIPAFEQAFVMSKE
ncbi:hypothetical protein H1R20_g83, partial [Candolleomyces eurysporus]